MTNVTSISLNCSNPRTFLRAGLEQSGCTIITMLNEGVGSVLYQCLFSNLADPRTPFQYASEYADYSSGPVYYMDKQGQQGYCSGYRDDLMVVVGLIKKIGESIKLKVQQLSDEECFKHAAQNGNQISTETYFSKLINPNKKHSSFQLGLSSKTTVCPPKSAIEDKVCWNRVVFPPIRLNTTDCSMPETYADRYWIAKNIDMQGRTVHETDKCQTYTLVNKTDGVGQFKINCFSSTSPEAQLLDNTSPLGSTIKCCPFTSSGEHDSKSQISYEPKVPSDKYQSASFKRSLSSCHKKDDASSALAVEIGVPLTVAAIASLAFVIWRFKFRTPPERSRYMELK